MLRQCNSCTPVPGGGESPSLALGSQQHGCTALFQCKSWRFWEDQTLLVTLIHAIAPCVTGAAMLDSGSSPLSIPHYNFSVLIVSKFSAHTRRYKY